MSRVFTRCGAALIALGALASPAVAGPVTPGTLTPITLEVGGIGGSITFDAAFTAVLDWNIVVTGGTDAFGFTYTDFTYNSTNSKIGLFSNASVFNGMQLATLDIRTLDYPGTTGSRDLGLVFDRIPTVIPAGGVALTICSDAGRVCGDPASGINIPSGEAVIDPAAPGGWHTRGVTGGFFTISDPPGTMSLNFSAEPVLIPVDDGSGGDDTHVPEPATLALMALGGALSTRFSRNRRKNAPIA